MKVTWYDGKQNHPLVPTSYGNIATRKDIPAVDGRVMPARKLPAGKEIYGKDWTFKGALAWEHPEYPEKRKGS